MSDSFPEFSNDLQAIVKREAIAQSLKNGLSIRESINKTKTAPVTSSLSTKLVNEELFLAPEIAKTMNSLQKLVETEFKQIKGLSLVLIGSSVHGGALIRQLLDTSDQQDLDIAFLHDPDHSVTDDVIGKIRHFVLENGSKVSPKKLHTTGYHAPNIRSIQEAKTILNETTSQEILTKAILRGQIPLYFEPSFPRSVNENNKKFLLDALNHIYHQDNDLWQQITTRILKIWSQQHHIKAKHLEGKHTQALYESQHYPFNQPSQRSFHLKNEIEQQSQVDMLAPMIKLLNSTKDN